MIEKKTIVNQITVDANGNVMLQFALLLVEDGQVIDMKYHRTALEPGTPPDLQIAAVNEHLAQMGKEPVPADGLARIKALCAADPVRQAKRAELKLPKEK